MRLPQLAASKSTAQEYRSFWCRLSNWVRQAHNERKESGTLVGVGTTNTRWDGRAEEGVSCPLVWSQRLCYLLAHVWLCLCSQGVPQRRLSLRAAYGAQGPGGVTAHQGYIVA